MKALKYLIWLCFFVSLFSRCATAEPKYSRMQDIGPKVILEDPTKPEKWVEYGRACLFSNNQGGAVQAFKYAIELDKKYLLAYVRHSKLKGDGHE